MNIFPCFLQERAKQAKQKRPARFNKKVIDLKDRGDDEGVLDNLLECLQSGSMLQPVRCVHVCAYTYCTCMCVIQILTQTPPVPTTEARKENEVSTSNS